MRGVRTALLSGALVALTIFALAPILATGRAEAPFAWLTGSGRTGSARPVGPGGSPAGTSSTTALAPLFDALGARRPVEPRLTGSSAHAPCEAPPAGPDDLIPLPRCSPLPEPGTEPFRSLTRASAALLADDGAGPSPDLLHARGVWYLLWPEQDGAPSRAVEALETAALRTPDEAAQRARILSDLAAAYLVRAAVRDRPLDLIQAMDAADRALEADPDLPEARFNHALALEKLSLRTPARAAWETYLDADATSPWAAEALRRHRILDEPTVLEAWETDRPILALAAAEGDTEAVRTLVRRYAAPARDWVEEEILPAWGEAVLAGDDAEAERLLRIARRVARVLAAEVGEHLPADAVESIGRALGPARDALASGHHAFGVGFGHYREHDCAAASEAFAEAEEELAAVGSPFAERAALQRAICTYYVEPETALASLTALLDRLPPDRYPSLRGRTYWMVGTARGDQGGTAATVVPYAAGVDAFEQTGDPDAGTLLTYLARSHEVLGDATEVWSHQYRGLSILAPHGDPRRLYNAIYGIVRSILDRDRPDLAVHFQDELVSQAQAWGEPGPLADAYLSQSKILLALGDVASAQDALREAEATTDLVPDGPIRARLAADVRAGRSAVLVETEPTEAVTVLDEAIAAYRDSGHVFALPDLLVSRARAHLAVGDVDPAEADLDRAIEELERRSREASSEADRIAAFDRAQPAYDLMVRLQMDRRGDPMRALEYADRPRGRELRRTLLGSPEAPAAALATDFLPPPPDRVVAEYAVLGDRVLIWILGPEIRTASAPIGATELARRVDRLRKLIETRSPEAEIRRAGATLFDQLVRPVLEGVPPETQMILVPDRSLHRLPFAALWNRTAKAYLIERHAVALAPNLQFALRRGSSNRSRTAPASVLAVGAPAFDRRRFELPRLASADDEARDVAALYTRAELLTGPRASPAAVERALRGVSVVHVASHALLDRDRPERSLLVLAPGKPGLGDGESRDDGALRAEQIARLHLPATELVYLSACRSVSAFPGSGREGPAGLARAFLAAGVPTVLANLWDADDRAAAALATEVHRGIRRGLEPAEALRTGQRRLSTSADPALHHPHAWAPVSLVETKLPISK